MAKGSKGKEGTLKQLPNMIDCSHTQTVEREPVVEEVVEKSKNKKHRKDKRELPTLSRQRSERLIEWYCHQPGTQMTLISEFRSFPEYVHELMHDPQRTSELNYIVG